MGKNKKVIQPQENIEYTFIFPGRRIFKFIYYGVKDNGRLMFFNVISNSMTDMSPERFSYLHQRQLLSKRVVVEPTQKIKNHNNEDLKIIKELRSITTKDKKVIYELTNIDVDTLADQFEDGLKNSWPDFSVHATLSTKYIQVKEVLG